MFFVCYLTFNAAKVANYFGMCKDFEDFNMNLTQVRKKISRAKFYVILPYHCCRDWS